MCGNIDSKKWLENIGYFHLTWYEFGRH